MTFKSTESSVETMEEYIRNNLDGRIDMALGESFGVVTANISLVQSVHIVLYRKKGYYVSDFCNHWNVYFRQLCLLASVRHISGL